MIFSAEWTYLLTERKVGDEDSAFSFVRIKYGDHETDTVTGTIIYPDDFSFSEVGVAALKFGANPRFQGEIDKATWEALESVGCIFLPTSENMVPGTSGEPTINEANVGLGSHYWSANTGSAANAYNLYFSLSSITGSNYLQRYRGFPVRLAQDYNK